MLLAAHSRVWRPGRPVDLGATLGPLRRGSGDPCLAVDAAGAWWRATLTPGGPATLRVQVDAAAGEVRGEAWGPGADWVLETLPALLGARDDPGDFRTDHPVLREVWRRHPGWRVPRTGRVVEALVPAVLEQKVTGTEAWRAYRTLVRRYGEPAPGPLPLLLPPAPRSWALIPSWEWHRAGVDQARSRAVVTAVRAAGRLEALTALAPAEAQARLRTLPGIGAWTAAEVAQRALGDADAVSVGDFHLPKLVGTVLAGRRVDDTGMLELLEPYRGHRYRVVRLVELSGLGYERRGPRLAPRDFRRR